MPKQHMILMTIRLPRELADRVAQTQAALQVRQADIIRVALAQGLQTMAFAPTADGSGGQPAQPCVDRKTGWLQPN